MNRCGRPKKNGIREANGRLQRGRDPTQVEKLQVLSQQHRRGETDQRIESPLGRLTLKHKLDRAYFDAGLEYAGMVRCYYAARLPSHALRSIPQLPQDDRVAGGDGVRPEKAIWLS